MVKICKECGKQFVPRNGMQLYCDDQHYRKCVVCGKMFPITRYHLQVSDAKQTCSRKCNIEMRKRTNIEKYGGTAPACSKDIQAKMVDTTRNRYGVDHAMQSDRIKQKAIETSLDRYGVPFHQQTEERRRELSERWADDEYRSRVISSRTETNMKKYGHEYTFQVEEIHDKWLVAHMTDGTKIDKFKSFKEDAKKFILDLNLDHKPTITELTKIVGVNESTVGVYIHKFRCEDLVNIHYSVMEQEVCEFIRTIVPGIEIVNNDHSVIAPYEIDIYLPEYSIGIECNPTATHNSTRNVFSENSDPLPMKYHKMKTELCEKNGVFLFHIFGYEWIYKKEIIKSMIANMLNADTSKVFARKTEIKEIDWKTCKDFLDANHRQGNANSKIRLGLYSNNELVAVMTFGRIRNTIGTTPNEDMSDCWELVRFCSKLNTCVVGGASKLFNYFINKYNPERIRSFSDRAHTKGNLYKILGFKYVRTTDPGYLWVELNSELAYNRYHAQKQNIVKFLNAENIDINKTEKQIMEEHEYVQVFDSGSILWEWRK